MNVSFKAIAITTPNSYNRVKKDCKNTEYNMLCSYQIFYSPINYALEGLGKPSKPDTGREDELIKSEMDQGVILTHDDLKNYYESQGLKLPDHVYQNKRSNGEKMTGEEIRELNEACRTFEKTFPDPYRGIQKYLTKWIKEHGYVDASGKKIIDRLGHPIKQIGIINEIGEGKDIKFEMI